jgi:hypothetical protein
MPKDPTFLLRVRTYEDEPDLAHVHLARRDGREPAAREGVLYGAMRPESAKKLVKELGKLGIAAEFEFVESPEKVLATG